MEFSREGIENVRVHVLPDAVAADGQCVALSRTALVTWRSDLTGTLFQAYVNGRRAGVTGEPRQRHLIVRAPGSCASAARIEIIAVAPRSAQVDFGQEVGPASAGRHRVTLSLLRSQSLPSEARADIYFDNGTGQVDYSEPLNAIPLALWPYWQDKAGHGMAGFGTGDFGYDAAAAVGLGQGRFGHGQFGLDADAFEWTTPPLPLGAYRFGVKVTDGQGNESPARETEPIAVLPPAPPATTLDIVTFDERTSALTLGLSDHP